MLTHKQFIIELLFAGMVNTVANGAWILCFLAQEPEWYAKVQSEVDRLLAKHRKVDCETAVDLLPRVALEEWETSLPALEICLRETLRLKVNGTCVRKNLSGSNVPIPGTKEVVPPQAFCVSKITQGTFLHTNWLSATGLTRFT